MYQIIGEVLVMEQHSIQLWKVQTTELKPSQLIYFSLKGLNYINLVCRLSKFAKCFRKEENI